MPSTLHGSNDHQIRTHHTKQQTNLAVATAYRYYENLGH